MSRRPINGQSKHIVFFGEDFFTPAKSYTFSVLAGDTPPKVVGGYGKWKVIDRPLRRGITTFTGYDPMSMRVSVRFMRFDNNSSWLTDDAAGLAIEKDIEILEWMGGESILVGPTPKVYLTTYDGQGRTVPLIPFEYQADSKLNILPGVGGEVPPWIVIGLEWDDNPVRNSGGYRVRQDATVTVQYYQSATSDRAGRSRPKARTFVSRKGADTPLLIARREPTSDAQTLAVLIKQAAQNKTLHLRSINQHIKHGKKVYVPAGS